MYPAPFWPPAVAGVGPGTDRVILGTLGWLAGTWLLSRVPRCRPVLEAGEEGAASLAGVSVVIPARNEEEVLPHLLSSLRAQAPGPSQVVVVDDHSSDATARVAAESGAKVISCDPLPRGWTGKSWACWTGAKRTDGATLVFLDADTKLEPGALARMVSEHRRRRTVGPGPRPPPRRRPQIDDPPPVGSRPGCTPGRARRRRWRSGERSGG